VPENPAILDTGRLNNTAYNQNLWQASDTQTSIITTGPTFVLWAGSSKGLPIRLISCRLTASTAITATMGTIFADPGLARGNLPVSCYLGPRTPQAYNEAASAATFPTPAGVLNVSQISTSYTIDLLSPAVLWMPPNTGVIVTVPVAVQTVTIVWLWAEIPADPFIHTVGADFDPDAPQTP